jgi:signal-transduction protein with cAMP-binding, CBS, and nucleotidyltransferase domain
VPDLDRIAAPHRVGHERCSGVAMAKPKKVLDVMSRNVFAVGSDATLLEVARMMRDQKIGDVLVTHQDGTLRGILTDRDLVVRGIADGRAPEQVKAAEICSEPLVTVGPNDAIDDAIRAMRQKSIRRLPVVRDGKTLGIVSMGDLARRMDVGPVLADISSARPNN